jgi:hypothetical protein
MNEEITASFHQNAQAMRVGAAVHVRRSRLLFLIFTAAIFGFLAWEKALTPVLAAALLLACILSLGLLHLASLFIGIRQLFGYNETIVWKINSSGLNAEAKGKRVSLTWDEVYGAKQSVAGTLIYPSKRLEGSNLNTYFWLPKTAFTSEADYLRFLDLFAAKTTHLQVGQSFHFKPETRQL